MNYRDSRPLYTQIIEQFQREIGSGVLQRGDKLPSVRELACQMAINPNTIQRAYRELEMEGWIASLPGKGSYVCGIPSGAVKDQLLEQFDTLVVRLKTYGLTDQELTERITQGGQNRA